MVVIRKRRSFYFYFDLPKNVDRNLKHEIIKSNASLAENKKKTRLNNYCTNISMGKILMKTENSRTNETHKFVLNSFKTLDLRSLNKHVAYKKLCIYYTWKNIRQQ